MRKACVVLVSLFIGLSSGFIVPSGVSKAFNDFDSSKSNSTASNLEKLDTIDESELYQNSANKTDNVNERSYKIYKKIYRNQLYKSLVPRISVQTVKKSDLRKNLSLKYKEAQKVLSLVNPYQKQMFFPSIGSQKLQHALATYRDKYLSSSTKQNDFTSSDTTFYTPNIKNEEQEPTLTPVTSKFIDKNIEYFKPNKKTNVSESVVDTNKLLYRLYPKDTITDFAINEPIMKNNMQIKSHTQRKPYKQTRCGFLKPNQLHRATFNKKQFRTGETFSPVQIDGPNIDPSLGNMNDVDDEKLVRFIKDTLAETETDPTDKRRSLISGNCDESNTQHNNEDNELSSKLKLIEMVDIFENSKIDENIPLTTKESASAIAYNKQDFVHGFNIKITNGSLTT